MRLDPSLASSCWLPNPVSPPRDPQPCPPSATESPCAGHPLPASAPGKQGRVALLGPGMCPRTRSDPARGRGIGSLQPLAQAHSMAFPRYPSRVVAPLTGAVPRKLREQLLLLPEGAEELVSRSQRE